MNMANAQDGTSYLLLAAHQMVLVNVVLPALAVVTAITFGARLLHLLSRGKKLEAGSTGLIAAFACLGIVVGILTGSSRTPVVGSLLPALLTLLGASLAYLFGKESLAVWRPAIPYCLIALMLAALYGIFMGGTIRDAWEENAHAQHAADLYYERVILEVAKQKNLDDLKKAQMQNAERGANPSAP